MMNNSRPRIGFPGWGSSTRRKDFGPMPSVNLSSPIEGKQSPQGFPRIPLEAPPNSPARSIFQNLAAAALLNQRHVGLQYFLRGRVGQVDGGPALGGKIAGHRQPHDLSAVMPIEHLR